MIKENLRQIYIDELIKISKQNKKIVCLDSDSKEPLLLNKYYSKFPKRCFSFGISEQDMVTASGGMSLLGLIPFVHSYGIFIVMRALDQLRNSISYGNLNVKFILSHHGLDAGSDGITHQLVEDYAIINSIPNIEIFYPSDSIELKQILRYSIKKKGPIIIKLGKSKIFKVNQKKYKWTYGRLNQIKDGKGCAIICDGNMISTALDLRKRTLAKYKKKIKIINVSTITHINKKDLIKLLKDIKIIVTIEDHSLHGGIGSIIQNLIKNETKYKIFNYGLARNFAECGEPKMLISKYIINENSFFNDLKFYLNE